MREQTKRRVLIVGMDGMRPDLMNMDVMPRLASLIPQGIRLTDHHAVYPAHTRANISSLATGTLPPRHGFVANVFRTDEDVNDGVINTADWDHIRGLDAATGGNALKVPTLADILDRHDLRLAVAATASPGAGILWTRNQLHRVVNPNSDYGSADLASLREKLGSIPPGDLEHRFERQYYAARAVADLFLHDPEIAVTVLWLNEPDSSNHYYGLGAPEVDDALRTCDESLGIVLDSMDRQGIRDRFDIFVISDHGHSTVQHHRNLGEYIDRAKRDLGASAFPDVAIASDYIYATDPDAQPASYEPLVRWIQAQPWAGAVFGTGAMPQLPGVIPLQAVWGGVTGDRLPLLAVSPTWSDEKNEFDAPGSVAALTEQVVLRSTHGAASPYDQHAFALAVGPDFRTNEASDVPTGAIDLAPTVLHLLGLDHQGPMDGRVWWEALVNPAGEPGDVAMDEIGAEVHHPDGFDPRVMRHRVGKTTYLDRALNGWS